MDILKNKDVISNTPERCYFCKKQMFSLIKNTAANHGITTLLHGINLDDLNDFRPGLKASQELGFFSPLANAGFFKKDIRELSKQMRLETWDKPSQSCFATRIAYNEKITGNKLFMIQKAETFLRDLGFVYIRVRCLGKTARIEVDPEQIDMLFDHSCRKKISHYFLSLGFRHTSVDIDGYALE